MKFVPRIRFLGAAILGAAAQAFFMVAGEYRPAVVADAVGFAALAFIIAAAIRRKQLQLRPTLLLLLSLSCLAAATVNGIYYLLPSEVVRLSLYLRAFFIFHVTWLIVLYVRGGSLRTMAMVTILASGVILHQGFFNGVTFRALPLLIYALAAELLISRRIPRASSWLHLLLLLGLALAFVSSALAADPYRAWTGFALIATSLLCFSVASRATARTRRGVIQFIVAQYLLLALAFLVIQLGHGGIRSIALPADRTAIAGINVNSIGTALAFASPLVIYHFRGGAFFQRSAGLLGLIIVAVVIYSCRNRAALLALFVAVAIYFLAVRHPAGGQINLAALRKQLGSALAIALALVVGAIALLNLGFVDLTTLDLRWRFWKLFAVRTVEIAPYFGFGPDNVQINAFLADASLDESVRTAYRQYLYTGGLDLHAHNHLVMIAFSFGIPGALLFGTSVLLIAFKVYRVARRRIGAQAVAILAALAGLGVSGLVDFTLWEPNSILLCAILIGLLVRQTGPDPIPRGVQRAAARLQILALSLAAIVSLFIAFEFSVYARRTQLLRRYLDFSPINAVRLRADAPPVLVKEAASIQSWRRRDYFLPVSAQLRAELELAQAPDRGESALRGALQQFEICADINPWSPYCFYRAAEIHLQLGEEKAAAAAFAEAKKRDPHGLLQAYGAVDPVPFSHGE